MLLSPSQSFLSFFIITHLFTAFLRLLNTVKRASLQMGPSNNLLLRLRAQIASLESTIADLKTQLADAEAYHNQTKSTRADTNGHSETQNISYPPVQPAKCNNKTFETLVDRLELLQGDKWGRSWELTSEEHKRYGRQLIMPEIGLTGGPSFP